MPTSIPAGRGAANKFPAETAILLVVPYLCKQGAYRGVESERHLQPDLTPEIFNKRYPGFQVLEQIVVNQKVVGSYYTR